ncbi:hypothetical protein GCM10027579_23640 [Calidifontibacter terrae]
MRPNRRKEYAPHRRCPVTKKVCFPDHSATIPALWRAVVSRLRAEEEGRRCGRQECRSYKCLHCKQWHLTSKA